MTLFEFLGAFGIGGLLATFVQFLLNEHFARRKAVFHERREAYLGFVVAFTKYVNACRPGSSVADRWMARSEIAHWHARLYLVGSRHVAVDAKETIRAFEQKFEQETDTKGHYNNLIKQMRDDLGMSKAWGEPYKDWLDDDFNIEHIHKK